MSNKIRDVLVVGGGDAGLLTALALRKMNPGMRIAVVDDFERQIPQVGKSTYKKIQNILHGTLEIDENRFIAEVRPIWKGSVYFRDWCDRPDFHFPFDPEDKFPATDTPDAIEHYYHHYDELSDSPDHLTKGESIVEQRKSPWYFGPDGDLDRYRKVAYHLNTKRFNSFLRELCEERGISLVKDEITQVNTTGSHIDAVRSEQRQYEADLFVDATGFDRVLRQEQAATFRDFDFPLDSALNVRIDRPLDEVIPATIVESADYGWFWHIDTYDNRDLGYVYSAEHVDDETAMAEFLDHVPEVTPATAPAPNVAADDVTKFEFDSGYYDRSWKENCVTIGNAAGFVEPLQSTGLTANATAAVKLANLLSTHGRVADDDIRERYNTWVGRIWESVHDFISIHYLYGTGDTDFWHDVSTMAFDQRVDRIIEQFDRGGFGRDVVPLSDDMGLMELSIFLLPDFYTMMRNLGAESVFYESNDFDVSTETASQLDQFYSNIEDEVGEHLTTEELYTDVLNF